MFWKLFCEKKPKENGWYLCTIEEPGLDRYTTCLYYKKEGRKFLDTNRMSMFYEYDVYGYNLVSHEYDINVNSDHYCDMTDRVVAWKKRPRAYMGDIKRKKIIYEDHTSLAEW